MKIFLFAKLAEERKMKNEEIIVIELCRNVCKCQARSK